MKNKRKATKNLVVFLYKIIDNLHIKNGDDMANFLPVLYRAFISLATLFIVAKILGKKQVSQFSLFDYVIGISIGNFAAEMTINLDSPEFDGILAVLIFGFIAYIVSYLALHSIHLRRFFMGVPTIIIQDGKLLRNNMKKARLDMNNLLEEARIKGYFDLSQIQYGVMEANGEISFLPYAEYQPLTPKVMNQKVTRDYLMGNVIIDGRILSQNLRHFGKDVSWLKKQIHDKGYQEKDILLATLDETGKLTIFNGNENIIPLDVLE